MKRKSLQPLVALALLGTGAVGVLAAHWMDYGLVFRDPAVRAHVLASSGHAYISSLLSGAIMGGFLGAAVVFCVGWAQGVAGPARLLSLRGLFVRLACLQVGGFVLMESLERLQSGLPAHHMWSPVLPLGVLLQILAAAIGALILWLLLRLGHFIGESLSKAPTRGSSRTAVPVARQAFARRSVWLSGGPTRAPPASIAA